MGPNNCPGPKSKQLKIQNMSRSLQISKIILLHLGFFNCFPYIKFDSLLCDPNPTPCDNGLKEPESTQPENASYHLTAFLANCN